MNSLRLQQLQRLGIDIWVTPNQAEELIQAGEAQSLFESNTYSATARSLPDRWGSKRERKSQSQLDSRTETRPPSSSRTQHEVARQRSNIRVVEKTKGQSFHADFFVYLFSNVAIVLEKSSRVPEKMLNDLLFSLSDFQIHPKYSKKDLIFVNQLEFQYPVGGVSLSNNATVAGAQDGFRVWFSKSARKCTTLVTIGATPEKTVAKVDNVKCLHIEQAEVLGNADAKLKLWEEIQTVLN